MASRKKLSNISKLPPLTEAEEEYVSRAGSGALLNPRYDVTFKEIFTQNTPESRAALHSFLEAATERKITKVDLIPNEAHIDYLGQRGVRYDIMTTFADSERANIEMQAFKQEYDYGKRAEYHVARILAASLKQSDFWERANKAYQISVLDFNYDETSPGAISRYAMRTEDGRRLADLQNVIFLELPKIKNKEKTLESNTLLENWAIFLKEADNPNKTEIIKQLTEKEEGLMQAQKVLSKVSKSEIMWLAQFRAEVAERDRRSDIAAATSKAIKKGIEQGSLKKAVILAKKFMALGHSKEEAAEFAEIDVKLLD